MSPPSDVPRRDLRYQGHGGVAIRADGWGDPSASPVVFLHGGGQTRAAWGGAARALARAGRYAVCLDLRGHGESDWAPDSDYRLRAFIADLDVVIGTFERPPALVGASLGGLAILLAAGEAERLHASALVLVDIAPRLERAGSDRIVGFMDRPEGFASLEEAADAIAAFTRNRSRERNLAGLEKVLRRGDDDRYRWHWDPIFLTESGPAEIADRERLLRAAGSLTLPTLLVRGRESDVLSLEGARELLAHVPHAEFVDVSGAGHMVAGDRNDAFTEAVADFLARRA